MGFIRNRFGRITIESRRESFIIHAGYGYTPGGFEISKLDPGDEFGYPGPNSKWEVYAIFKDRVDATKPDGTMITLPRDTFVYVEGHEVDAEGSHAALWRDHPHPEFLNEDLDDLIKALADFYADQST